MRVSLLTHHPQQFTQQRFVTEARALGFELSVLRPTDICWQWPNKLSKFDVTFNRLSVVDSTAFELSLGGLPTWGVQVNPWELRLKLWDKSRQVLWLAEQGLAPAPTFMHKGHITSEDPQWRAFAQEHDDSKGWVLKFNRGQRGVGVNFLADEAALFGWLETLSRMGDQDFIIQPRLDNTQEYRITLLNGRPWALLKRDGGRANFAQGGTAEEVPLKDWPKEIQQIIDVLGRVGAGTYLAIDVLLTAKGARILDVNSCPGVEQLELVTKRNFTRDLMRASLELPGSKNSAFSGT